MPFSSLTGHHNNLFLTGNVNSTIDIDPGIEEYWLTNTVPSEYFVAKLKEVIVCTTLDTITWTGALDTYWNNPGNWDLGHVPEPCNIALIPGTAQAPLQPVINSPALCYDLEIRVVDGGHVLITGGGLSVLGLQQQH